MATKFLIAVIFLALSLQYKKNQVEGSDFGLNRQKTVSAPTTAQPPFPMHGINEGSLQPEECSGRCSMRCSSTQYKKPCLFFCQKCCAKCLCVPPGTYGNKQVCPCYNSWKTKRGGPKCP